MFEFPNRVTIQVGFKVSKLPIKRPNIVENIANRVNEVDIGHIINIEEAAKNSDNPKIFRCPNLSPEKPPRILPNPEETLPIPSKSAICHLLIPYFVANKGV